MITAIIGTTIVCLGAGLKMRSNKKKYVEKKKIDLSMKLALNKRNEFLNELRESNKKVA